MATRKKREPDLSLADSTPRSIAALERRAIASGWATPEAKKRKIVRSLLAYFDPKTPEGKDAKPRYKIAAARTLMSADLRQQMIDLEKQRIDIERASESGLATLLRKAAEYDDTSRGDAPL
jgi:hypothetical protein